MIFMSCICDTSQLQRTPENNRATVERPLRALRDPLVKARSDTTIPMLVGVVSANPFRIGPFEV